MVKVFRADPDRRFKRPQTYLFERKIPLTEVEVWTHCWITFYEYDTAVVMPLVLSQELTLDNQNLPCIVVGATESILQNTEEYRMLDHEVLGFPIPTLPQPPDRDSRQIQLRDPPATDSDD